MCSTALIITAYSQMAAAKHPGVQTLRVLRGMCYTRARLLSIHCSRDQRVFSVLSQGTSRPRSRSARRCSRSIYRAMPSKVRAHIAFKNSDDESPHPRPSLRFQRSRDHRTAAHDADVARDPHPGPRQIQQQQIHRRHPGGVELDDEPEGAENGQVRPRRSVLQMLSQNTRARN